MAGPDASAPATGVGVWTAPTRLHVVVRSRDGETLFYDRDLTTHVTTTNVHDELAAVTARGSWWNDDYSAKVLSRG